MKQNNIVRFFIIFIVSYFILIGAHQFEVVRKIHTNIFIGFEQFTFNLFNPNIRTDFKLYKPIDGVPYQPDQYDYSIDIYDKKQWNNTLNKAQAKPMSVLNASMDNTGIGPMILFLALLIATPVLWKRKLVYLLVGALLIYTLVALKYSYMFYENIDSLESKGLWGVLSNLFGGAFRSHEFMLMNVLFVWILVCIRSKEIKWFMN